MHTIYLPTFAANRRDVEIVLSILEREVLKNYPGRFNIGLEIGGKPSHFQEPEHLANIVKNVKELAEGVKISIHGFTGLAIYTEGIADMSKPVGRELLCGYIELGKKLGSSYVHVHGAAGYVGLFPPKDKSEVLKRIRGNLLFGFGMSGGIPIGIENIPSPSCHDLEIDPEKVISDYVEGVGDCMQVVEGTPLKTTFDTCHYAARRNGYIDLIEPVKRMGYHFNHLHISDASGYWEPNVARGGEGSIPGEGRIGKDSFANFFRYIRENHPDMGVCAEVYFRDPVHPIEFEEAVKRICKWLSG